MRRARSPQTRPAPPPTDPAGRPRQVVGCREAVRFPEWGLRLRAKVDTGARTSALDVDGVERVGPDTVRFWVVFGRDRSRRREVEARVTRVSRVRPSSGTAQERYFVEALIRLGNVEKRIEVSLVPRHGMLNRMLLGRSALSGDFLVDPDARYRLGRLAPKGDKTR